MNPKIADVITMMTHTHDAPDTPAPVKQWLAGLISILEDSDIPDQRFVKGSPLPSAVGELADEYAMVRAERLRIAKEADAVKERETEIYNVIMSILDESTDTGASGKTYRVQRVEKDRINVVDWPTLWKWIAENDGFDMLQKRLNDKAVDDRFGEALVKARDMVEGYLKDHPEADPDTVTKQALDHLGVPGIKAVKVPTLSFTKV